MERLQEKVSCFREDRRTIAQNILCSRFPMGPSKNRKEAFQNVFRYWNGLGGVERNQFPCCTATSGSGKTHLMSVLALKGRWNDGGRTVVDDEYLTALEPFDEDFKTKIEESVPITVTFNFNTNLGSKEENIISLRILAGYFFKETKLIELSNFLQGVNISILQALEIIAFDLKQSFGVTK